MAALWHRAAGGWAPGLTRALKDTAMVTHDDVVLLVQLLSALTSIAANVATMRKLRV